MLIIEEKITESEFIIFRNFDLKGLQKVEATIIPVRLKSFMHLNFGASFLAATHLLYV